MKTTISIFAAVVTVFVFGPSEAEAQRNGSSRGRVITNHDGYSRSAHSHRTIRSRQVHRRIVPRYTRNSYTTNRTYTPPHYRRAKVGYGRSYSHYRSPHYRCR